MSACICEYHKALKWDRLHSLISEVICFLDCLVFLTFISEQCNRKWNYTNGSLMWGLLSGRCMPCMGPLSSQPLGPDVRCCFQLSCPTSGPGDSIFSRWPREWVSPIHLPFPSYINFIFQILLNNSKMPSTGKGTISSSQQNNAIPSPICRIKCKLFKEMLCTSTLYDLFLVTSMASLLQFMRSQKHTLLSIIVLYAVCQAQPWA